MNNTFYGLIFIFFIYIYVIDKQKECIYLK